ncbi:MAG TPA: hypothetical protein VGG38_06255 [Acidimicrobiales bacterium]
MAQAKKHLLVLSDLPKEWSVEKGTSGSGGSGGFPGGSQLASCIGVPASVINDNSPSSTGPYYQNKGQTLEVQDSVTVFPSASYARTEFAAMANPKTPGCMATLMNGPGKSAFGAQKGETVGTITVTSLAPKVYGPDVVGIVMNLPITYEGVTMPTQLISVNGVRGRFGQSITYDSYGIDFPGSLAKHLDSVALHRL